MLADDVNGFEMLFPADRYISAAARGSLLLLAQSVMIVHFFDKLLKTGNHTFKGNLKTSLGVKTRERGRQLLSQLEQ